MCIYFLAFGVVGVVWSGVFSTGGSSDGVVFEGLISVTSAMRLRLYCALLSGFSHVVVFAHNIDYYIPQRFTSIPEMWYILNRASIFCRLAGNSSYRVASVLGEPGTSGSLLRSGHRDGANHQDHVRPRQTGCERSSATADGSAGGVPVRRPRGRHP